MPVYKDEKKGTWFAKFNYKDWNGKIIQKKKEGFATKREAKEYEASFLDKSTAKCDMLFGNLCQLYMEDCKTRLKPTTYENKEWVINLKVLPFFKDMPINTIEPSTVRRWQNELLADKKNYSPTYLKTVNNQISAIFNYAVKYYKLPSNPARIAGSIGKKHAEEMHFWTASNFNQFISFSDNKMYSVIYELLFWTGMRIGECLALTLNDFDFQAKTVSVSKNFANVKGEDLILPPKTPKSKRKITLPDFICDMVKEHAARLYEYQPSERLFPIYRSTINQHLARTCKKSGVKKIRVHDLRHSHASLLIEMGFSPLLISERLGHENIETTLQTYSHLYPNKHGEVADKLQEMNQLTSRITTETSEK